MAKTSHGKFWKEVGNLIINWIEKNCKLRTDEKLNKTENLTSWKYQRWKNKSEIWQIEKLQTIVSNENLKRKTTI